MVSGDARAVIIKVVQTAQEPLTAAGIQKQLPVSYRLDIKTLVGVLSDEIDKKTIFKWLPWRKNNRYWKRDPNSFVENKAMEFLEDRPLTRTLFQNALKKALFGCSDNKAKELRISVTAKLQKERKLFEHPPFGRQRAARLSVNPPDPSLYLAKVKKEIEFVCKLLEKQGVTKPDVFDSVCSLLGYESAKKTQQFQRIDHSDSAMLNHACRKIIDKITEIEPAAHNQAPVWIPDLRSSLDLPKEIFDRAVLALFRQSKVFLNRHVHPSQMNEKERDQMIPDGKGNYYVVMVLRKGLENDQSFPE